MRCYVSTCTSEMKIIGSWRTHKPKKYATTNTGPAYVDVEERWHCPNNRGHTLYKCPFCQRYFFTSGHDKKNFYVHLWGEGCPERFNVNNINTATSRYGSLSGAMMSEDLFLGSLGKRGAEEPLGGPSKRTFGAPSAAYSYISYNMDEGRAHGLAGQGYGAATVGSRLQHPGSNFAPLGMPIRPIPLGYSGGPAAVRSLPPPLPGPRFSLPSSMLQFSGSQTMAPMQRAATRQGPPPEAPLLSRPTGCARVPMFMPIPAAKEQLGVFLSSSSSSSAAAISTESACGTPSEDGSTCDSESTVVRDARREDAKTTIASGGASPEGSPVRQTISISSLLC